MNQVYRVIYNRSLGVWQCVAETAKAQGKSKSIKVAVIVSALTSTSAYSAIGIDNVQDINQDTTVNESIFIGTTPSASGIINLKNATLSMNQAPSTTETAVISVGDAGKGIINADAGNIVSKDSMVISNLVSGSGIVNLKNQSSLTVARFLTLSIENDAANRNGGMINVEQGSKVNIGDTTTIANNGIGIATVKDAGSTFTTEKLFIGENSNSSGFMNVQDGANLTSNNFIVLGNKVGSSGSIRLC